MLNRILSLLTPNLRKSMSDPSMKVKPAIGAMVLYTFTDYDAKVINKRRSDAKSSLDIHKSNSNGVVIHFGSDVKAGEQCPMRVTRVHSDGTVNGRVELDGNDVYWVENISEGEGEDHWSLSTSGDMQTSSLAPMYKVEESGRFSGGLSEDEVQTLRHWMRGPGS